MEIPSVQGFEHLHISYDFSLLDGIAAIEDFCNFMKPDPETLAWLKAEARRKFRSIDDPWEAS